MTISTLHPDRVELEQIDLYIDGQARPAGSGARYPSDDPYTGRPWAEVADANEDDVDAAVQSAHRALNGPWGDLTATARGKLLLRLAELIEDNAQELAQLETRDNGKLLREMAGQARALPSWFSYYGGLADKVQGSVIPLDRKDFLVYTESHPIGVVAAITPWNSPLLLLTWKLAPALAAGCTVVVKPSDYTPASTVRLAELVTEAGIPEGVVNVVTGFGPTVGKALTSHPLISKIAFTGSTEVGKAVARTAAERVTRTTLELGGKSAQIVFPDADIEAAANGVIAGIFSASGQTCMAGSRLLVHSSVAEELVQKVVERAKTVVLGDPSTPTTEMGPLANDRQYAKVLDHFKWAVEDGATIACGGKPADGLGGYFVEPTVLTNLPKDARALTQEIFGPVLSVMTFESESEAIEVANGTEFGLAGSVWTRDIARGHRVAGKLRAGSVWVNSYRTVAPQVPFGGFGQSGLGRESGIEAIGSYQETKAIWVELSGETRDPFTIG
ncbi:aldehyde dehydrogenase (NAD+) [Arthrobacter sp. yr096]|uniref:aldehyde dehydrogenase n=1 Tax=Arthrobacter sp. yr096 TaxID=1761750 RepID=UPI0008AB1D11|nr:aldehyde dehydrogenase [Arthrobacter sp. yr096]SEJ78138.1 aldehyde dehydrogenase (NAD+) [Arthrobacter sp. yr096]